jgi:hypothetical protein
VAGVNEPLRLRMPSRAWWSCYLDGGFDAARNFVLRATEDDFERIARDPEEVTLKALAGDSSSHRTVCANL